LGFWGLKTRAWRTHSSIEQGASDKVQPHYFLVCPHVFREGAIMASAWEDDFRPSNVPLGTFRKTAYARGAGSPSRPNGKMYSGIHVGREISNRSFQPAICQTPHRPHFTHALGVVEEGLVLQPRSGLKLYPIHYPSRIAKLLTLYPYGAVSSLLYYPLLFERYSYFDLHSIIAGTASIRQCYTPKQRLHLGWVSEPQSQQFKLYPTPCMYWFELVAI